MPRSADRRSIRRRFDEYGDYFHHIDGEPLGWNAVIGVRPLPILGAEAEYIDFGDKRLGAGAPYLVDGDTQQFLGGDSHDRAAAVFAVGYLPLPIPWVEPFAKLGWGQIWEHDNSSGIYNNVIVNGARVGRASVSQSSHPSGATGGGLQFHFSQLGVRAQFESALAARAHSAAGTIPQTAVSRIELNLCRPPWYSRVMGATCTV